MATNSSGEPISDASPTSGYFPANLESAYQLPSGTAGAGETIGIVDAYNDPNAASDLGDFRSQFDLPPCTSANGCLRIVNEAGGSTLPSNNADWSEEISVDLDMASAICPNCHILLVEASSSSFSDLGTAVNEAASLGADVISNSYGGTESSADTTYDSEYYKHPGIMVTASSGDSGYGVEYPAASPYVTSVGGTTLTQTTSNPRGYTESIWDDAGSGCSAYDSQPSWQSDLGLSGCSKRMVADVSADSNPNTGVAVYDSYGTGESTDWLVFGGTSVANIVIASIYALGGDTASLDYASGAYSNTAWLNNVTTGGTNVDSGKESCAPSYLCTAGTGYNGPTGLGTPISDVAFGGASAAPTVTGVNSSSGPPAGGTSVTVTGANFYVGSTFAVDFGTSPATNVSVSSPSELTATAPAGSGTVNVTVTSPVGTSATSSTDDYTYGSAAADGTGTMTVSPTSVTAGSTGNQFTFTFSAPGSAGFASGSEATVEVPSGWTAPTTSNTSATAGTCTLGTLSVSGSGPWTLTVPMACAAGNSFTITYGTTSNITATSTTGTASFTTETEQDGGSLSDIATSPTVTVNADPVPRVGSVSPSSGPTAGKTPISITGTGFVSGATVEIGQGAGAGPTAIMATSVDVVSSTEITAVTGSGAKAGTWNLFVTTSGGTSAADTGDDFTYAQVPSVSKVNPNSGPTTGGTAVTITGTGFVAGATVEIGQGGGAGPTAIMATSVDVVSSTEITAETGSGAKAGTFSLFVTTSGGTSAANTADDFTYS